MNANEWQAFLAPDGDRSETAVKYALVSASHWKTCAVGAIASDTFLEEPFPPEPLYTIGQRFMEAVFSRSWYTARMILDEIESAAVEWRCDRW